MSSASAPHLLTRTSHRKRDGAPVTFLGDLTLARSRAHELCGNARRTLALMVAQSMSGLVLWVRPSWAIEGLHPDGFGHLVNPSRLVFVGTNRAEDLLWAAEEALRAGEVPLVVVDLPGPPSLTAVRRLHLAAETGAELGNAPLGLLLTPGEGGAPGVESRWALTSAHGQRGAEGWCLDRRRARRDPEKRWRVSGGRNGLSLNADAAPEPA